LDLGWYKRFVLPSELLVLTKQLIIPRPCHTPNCTISSVLDSGEEEKGKSRSMQEDEEKLTEIRKEVATGRNQNLGFRPLFPIS
jgi:hypothetical protein